MIDIVDKYFNVFFMVVEDLCMIVGNRLGLLVLIFCFVMEDGREMYDGYVFYDYGIDSGVIIWLENWDGWNEFINLCIMGFIF